jgi:hypothetical protein
MQPLKKKKRNTTVVLEDTISKTLTAVAEELISWTPNHTKFINERTLDNYIISCIKRHVLD